MLPDDTRIKIKKSIAGIRIAGANDNCTTVRNILSAGNTTSTTVKTGIEGKAVVIQIEYVSQMLNQKSFNL